MPTYSTPLQAVRGVDFAQDFQAHDYMGRESTGVYLGSDAFAVAIWPAGTSEDSTLDIAASCTWLNASAGQWRLAISGQALAGLPEGVYTVLVKAVRGGATDRLMLADLTLLGAGETLAVPAISSVSGLPTASALARVSVLWCSDEDISIRCGSDYAALIPESQMLAEGSDGVFSSDDPWTLASVSNDFAAQLPALWTMASVSDSGALSLSSSRAGFICWLRKPFPGDGRLLATATTSSAGLTLRRLGMGSNSGQAPAPAAGLQGVRFQVASFYPQIEEATYRINCRWGIDPSLPGRMPSDLGDVRPLRRLCVAYVLLDRYTDESRGEGDYAAKVEMLRREIDELEGQLQLRWGTQPSSRRTNWFSTRIVR